MPRCSHPKSKYYIRVPFIPRNIVQESKTRPEECPEKKMEGKVTRWFFCRKAGAWSGAIATAVGIRKYEPTCLRRTYNMPKELAPSKPQQHCLHKKMNLTIPIPVSQLAWMGVSEHFFSRFPHAPGPPVEKGIISLFISVRIRT